VRMGKMRPYEQDEARIQAFFLWCWLWGWKCQYLKQERCDGSEPWKGLSGSRIETSGEAEPEGGDLCQVHCYNRVGTSEAVAVGFQRDPGGRNCRTCYGMRPKGRRSQTMS
jgi:hypothetical protein